MLCKQHNPNFDAVTAGINSTYSGQQQDIHITPVVLPFQTMPNSSCAPHHNRVVHRGLLGESRLERQGVMLAL